jgi:hypothetical protein
MPAGEFDVRVKQLEGSLDKAETLLQSAGQVLQAIGRAGNKVQRGSRLPLFLVVATTVIGAGVALFVVRRQET